MILSSSTTLYHRICAAKWVISIVLLLDRYTILCTYLYIRSYQIGRICCESYNYEPTVAFKYYLEEGLVQHAPIAPHTFGTFSFVSIARGTVHLFDMYLS